jgi:hypothetical protein
MIQDPAFDTHQFREPVSFGRVDRTDVVEVAIARIHDIGFDGLDQGRCIAITLPEVQSKFVGDPNRNVIERTSTDKWRWRNGMRRVAQR